MDALTYFFLNYGFYSLLLIVPAALLGAVYGWVRWGMHQAGAEETRKRMEDAKRVAQEVEIALSKEREQFKLYREAAEKGGTAPVTPPDFEREMAALRRDNEELEKILGVARKEREEAEENLATLREDKAALEKSLQEQQGKGKDKAPKGKAKGQAAPAALSKSELKRFKAEKRELEKKLSAQQREAAKKLATQEKAASKKTAELEKKLSALQAEFTKKTEEAGELLQAKSQLEAEVKSRVEEGERIGKELGQLKSGRGDLERELSAVVMERDEQLKELEATRKERQELGEKLKAEVKIRLEESGKLGTELAGLQSERAEIEKSLNAVRKERDQKLEELDQLKVAQDELAEKLALEVERHSDSQKKTATEIDDLRTKRNELESQLESLAREKEQGVADLEKISRERKELESKLLEAQTSATVAEAQLKEVTGDKKSLEADLSSTREERDDAKRTLETLRGEKSRMEVRVAELEKRLVRTESELEELSHAKAELEDRVSEAQSEVALVRMDLDLARQKIASEQEELERRKAAESRWADELHRLREEKKELNEHLAVLTGDSKAEILINQMKVDKERLLHDLEDQKRERQQVEDATGVLRREMHGLRSELVEVEKRANQVTEMEVHLRSAEERLTRTQGDLTRVLEERQRLADLVADLKSSPATPPSASSRSAAPVTAENRLTRESRSAAAAEELRSSLVQPPARKPAKSESDEQAEPARASGGTKRGGPDRGSGATGEVVRLEPEPKREGSYLDARYGLLHRSEPADADDLTEIKGVGEIIKKRLNKMGIYTFQQVANWKASHVKAVSRELKLRDRIKRGHWQEQAQALHRAKGGESA